MGFDVAAQEAIFSTQGVSVPFFCPSSALLEISLLLRKSVFPHPKNAPAAVCRFTDGQLRPTGLGANKGFKTCFNLTTVLVVLHCKVKQMAFFGPVFVPGFYPGFCPGFCPGLCKRVNVQLRRYVKQTRFSQHYVCRVASYSKTFRR